MELKDLLVFYTNSVWHGRCSAQKYQLGKTIRFDGALGTMSKMSGKSEFTNAYHQSWPHLASQADRVIWNRETHTNKITVENFYSTNPFVTKELCEWRFGVFPPLFLSQDRTTGLKSRRSTQSVFERRSSHMCAHHTIWTPKSPIFWYTFSILLRYRYTEVLTVSPSLGSIPQNLGIPWINCPAFFCFPPLFACIPSFIFSTFPNADVLHKCACGKLYSKHWFSP